MKHHALGMIEFNSIAAGIEASDVMVKAAYIRPMFFKTICPGKFLTAVFGDIADVKASIKAGLNLHPTTVVDHFTIANICNEVIKAMSPAADVEEVNAMGIIETFSAASSVVAADIAFKAAQVAIADIRIAMGLGGKAYTVLVGDVSAVIAATNAGSDYVSRQGLLAKKVIIPQPSLEVFKEIL